MGERHTIPLVLGDTEHYFTPTEARRIIGRLYRALTDPGPPPEHHERCGNVEEFDDDWCVAECPVRKAEEAQRSDYDRIGSIVESVSQEMGIPLSPKMTEMARRLVERGERLDREAADDAEV